MRTRSSRTSTCVGLCRSAINRQTIADTVYEGVRQPATSIVPEGVAGYLDGQWAYSKYDPEQAKQLLPTPGIPTGKASRS